MLPSLRRDFKLDVLQLNRKRSRPPVLPIESRLTGDDRPPLFRGSHQKRPITTALAGLPTIICDTIGDEGIVPGQAGYPRVTLH